MLRIKSEGDCINSFAIAKGEGPIAGFVAQTSWTFDNTTALGQFHEDQDSLMKFSSCMFLFPSKNACVFLKCKADVRADISCT